MVVLFHPNQKKLFENLNKIKSNFEVIVAISNGNNEEIHCLDKIENAKLIELHQNYGIAYAQNIGIKEIVHNFNSEYIMFLDQDSFLKANQIDELKEDIITEKNFAVLGPSFDKKGKGIVSVEQTLSSGSIIPIKCLQEIGLFKECLFIDLVDYDWCWRARKHGYEILVDRRIALDHKLGEGRKFGVRVAKPFRLYYQFRNIVYLATRREMPIKYAILSFVKLPLRFILYLILLGQKKERFFFMIRGLRDGVIGKMGKDKA